MSTIILGEKTTKSVSAFSIVSPMIKETLESYVRRVMREKGIKPGDVQRKSKGGVSDSYVGNILAGHSSNLTVDKLKALAVGLGVDEDELFDIARGRERKQPSGFNDHSLLDFVGATLELLRQRIGNQRFFDFLNAQMGQYTQAGFDSMTEDEQPEIREKTK